MRSTSVLAASLLTIAASAAPTLAETITIRSGQVSGSPGTAGQFDDTVRYLATNPPGAPISATPFTPAQYSGALTGPAAVVIDPVSVWTPGISDPAARWVSFGLFPGATYGASGSCLYAVPFFVTTPGATGGTISIEFAVDDGGGDINWGGGNNSFLYINGTPTGYSGGNYATPTVHTQSLAFTSGWNTIYLYQRDQGLGVSGLIFSFTIQVVPAPSAAATLALAGLLTSRRRR